MALPCEKENVVPVTGPQQNGPENRHPNRANTMVNTRVPRELLGDITPQMSPGRPFGSSTADVAGPRWEGVLFGRHESLVEEERIFTTPTMNRSRSSSLQVGITRPGTPIPPCRTTPRASPFQYSR